MIPEDWRKGVIVKLPKKGNLQVCDNWRKVTLLMVPGKILCRIIIDRIKGEVDCMLKGLGHAILGNFSTDRMVIELTKISK